jgi:hypothetical protein
MRQLIGDFNVTADSKFNLQYKKQMCNVVSAQPKRQ